MLNSKSHKDCTKTIYFIKLNNNTISFLYNFILKCNYKNYDIFVYLLFDFGIKQVSMNMKYK